MAESDVTQGQAGGTARKIIHIDCDCFYASVETRDDPSLRGKPVAVGGSPDKRGVIATCNYEARRFGIHSAMASAQAVRRCADLVLLFPNFDKYRIASRQVQAIYRQFTELIEPLSLDEAYLDVTGQEHCRGSATLMAQTIRQRIEAEVGITASAGIAPNKFVAKVASDWRKPNGQFVVRPEEVDAFVAALPVEKIFGVGKVTAARLHSLGANTCADLRSWSKVALMQQFGRFGERLYQLCRGVDNRPVTIDAPRRSLSVESTYTPDLADGPSCQLELAALFEDLVQRIAKVAETAPIHKAYVKIRFADFSHTTVECVANSPQLPVFLRLLSQGLCRGILPVRLLGVGVRYEASQAPNLQMPLFEDWIFSSED